MNKSDKLIIYTDGGARGNPGPAGIGVVIYDESGKVLKKYKKSLGKKTNNEAEYEALIAALKLAEEFGTKNLCVNMDSELVVKQLNGQYKIKALHIQELFLRTQKAAKKFSSVIYRHIPREKNQLADQLVNEAIDEAVK